MSATFQPMPELTQEQLDALRLDIATNGVIVPITVDQHGRILDGHNRARIAAEFGIDCPRVVREVADDEAAWDLAVTLNCARRHLTGEQKRHLINQELLRRFRDSDRAIARRVGCSPSTVGAVRAERRAEAEESTRRAQEYLMDGAGHMFVAASRIVMLGADLADLIRRAEAARDRADEVLRGLDAEGFRAEDFTDEHAAAVIDRFTYSTLAGELLAMHERLLEAGWKQHEVPLALPADELHDLVESLFPMSNLDTSDLATSGGAA